MKHRRAIASVELVGAAAIFAVVLSTAGLLAHRAATKRQQHWQQLVAHESLATLADEVACWSYADTTQQQADGLELPAHAMRQLPDARLLVSVEKDRARGVSDLATPDPSVAKPASRRVLLLISWKSGNGQPDDAVQSTVWKFK